MLVNVCNQENKIFTIRTKRKILKQWSSEINEANINAMYLWIVLFLWNKPTRNDKDENR